MTEGPLAGLRVVEMAGLAPAPFATTMLADHGAEVIRVDRTTPTVMEPDLLGRSRTVVHLDLKASGAVDAVLELLDGADVLIEGFRPGVMERLGLGPDVALARNPGLVYGRMTGWGQTGPLARSAGHDLNYIALSGALGAVGPAGAPPTPPLNLVGDFGGGGMLLAFGVLAALVERSHSGRGQVVDAAMVDGAAMLTTHLHTMLADGTWDGARGDNILDGGAPFYRCYTTSDDRYVSVGAIEPQFWTLLLEGLGLAGETLPDRDDRAQWPAVAERLAAVFATRTRDEWTGVFGGTDACVEPVLEPGEAPQAPANAERDVFVEVDGVVQPSPAPRFDRTPSSTPRPRAVAAGEDLVGWGLSATARDLLTRR